MHFILHRSLQRKEKIRIFYMDRSNRLTERCIRVIRINEDSIVAYCYWRKKVRTFKRDYILSAGRPKHHRGVGA
ncbi:hypothetical protein [Virgibacillus alimentarius]|uniref:DNA-binding transcriptional regulator YafY n=1 Tax=Virgibacillus alimentarius TaxID=698769 RepID=A0ABS4S7K6_9BACI|nr:hypothetical protein [Virgibacillus alimentarius]MBP2257455.1 putative DNA-binding transcriptional regulator YafY [Virgibacillus alimentarius]